jgi:GNAT superfamily N-acetyltransferase
MTACLSDIIERDSERGAGSLTRVDAAYAIRALDESTWPDFAALVEANNGVFGGCWCLGFHAEGGEKRMPVGEKRERKRRRVLDGTAHAALVYDDGSCVGWCEFGPPDELPRIKSRAAYMDSGGGSPDWRIACCFVGKGHRRRGVATAALRGALGLIAELGGGTVEGYPEAADAVPAGFLYNGALSTYEQLGFARDRMIGKHRWVVVHEVPPLPERAREGWPRRGA